MKIRVAVFFGGESVEHDVSIISANQVLHSLDSEKYEVFPVYITKNKDMYTGQALKELKNYTNEASLLGQLTKISFVKDGGHVFMRQTQKKFFSPFEQEIDVAFLVMHGTGGEDGTLQGFVEMLGLPYTSSSVLGAAIGQDKELMKQVLAYHHIPMIPWLGVAVKDAEDNGEKLLQEVTEKLGFPCIIKPANLGSSIGIEIAKTPEEFLEKVRSAAKFDFRLVIEKCLQDFREINCSVMGNRYEAKASVTEEIPRTSFLGFDEKYLKGGKTKGKIPTKAPKLSSKGMASLSRLVPAPLSEQQNKEVQDLAIKTFKVLRAHGLVRIDFMLANEHIYVNEINSIPGSLAYYLWQETGMSFSQECDELIRLAIDRQREKEKKVFSFESSILKNYGGR